LREKEFAKCLSEGKSRQREHKKNLKMLDLLANSQTNDRKANDENSDQVTMHMDRDRRSIMPIWDHY
jgi:uncharacterized protein Smg (DUF494 family)